MHARFAMVFKTPHQSLAAPQYGDGHAEALGQGTEDQHVRARDLMPAQRAAAAPAIRRVAVRIVAKDSERLGVIKDQQATVSAHRGQVIHQRREPTAPWTKAIRHYHRAT